MRKVLYVFGLLTDQDTEWMARTGSRRRLVRDEIVITEGEIIDFVAILLEGELQVSTRASGPVARLGVGEVVGEMSLVDSAPTSATIRASRDSLVLFIDKGKLLQKLETDDGFAARFYRALAVFLADRLRATNALFAGGAAVGRNEGPASDELDPNVLDHVFAAGERFSRMLRQLSVSSGVRAAGAERCPTSGRVLRPGVRAAGAGRIPRRFRARC
jgi:CRP/FNR family cyclic AMP-dependent transcriptional regulator